MPDHDTPDRAAGSAPPHGAQFRVLAVCTGNIVRSPALELLLSARVDASITVSSAGTHALVGSPLDPTMAALLAADGVGTDGFRARALTRTIVDDADLVLCLERSHRARVLEMAPGALRRTFTARELARLVASAVHAAPAHDPTAGGRLAATVSALRGRRGALGTSEHDDIADPLGGTARAYAAAYADISAVVRTLAHAVAPR